MDKQPRMIDANALSDKVQLKIDELNNRIASREYLCYADESETIEQLNCEAHAYEQVIKMLEGMSSVDPIPLPTIKPGDRVNVNCIEEGLFLKNVKIDHLRVQELGTYAVIWHEHNTIFALLKDLELIPNE